MEESNSETPFANPKIAKLLKSISSKICFRENNFIKNNTTRRSNIFWNKQKDVSY